MIRQSLSLRPYQEHAIADVRASLRRHQNVLLTAPTGSGKGFLAAWMVRESANRGLRSWLIAHRTELIDQLSAELWKLGVPHGVVQGGRTMTKDPVQVCSAMTLVRRLDKLPPPHACYVDEAHHAKAKTWEKIIDHCENSWVVGLTATPVRTSGEGLDDIFDDLVVGPTVAELIEQGHLADYRLFCPPTAMDREALGRVRVRGGDYAVGELEAIVDQSAVVGDAVRHYKKHVVGNTNGRPPTVLIYCVSRTHARHVEAAYKAAGIKAAYCGGDTPKEERDQIISDLRRGRLHAVASVSLFVEGLDVPGLSAVQMLRPTQSLGLWLQACGRALRPEKGKEYAIILDHVGASHQHGLPCQDRDWTLEGRKKRRDDEDSGPSIRTCEECFAVFRAIEGACPLCGWKPERQERDAMPEEVEGELQEVDPKELRRRRRREEAQADGLEDLVELAIERDYKISWAGIRHAIRQGHKPGSPAARKYIVQAKRIAKERTA